MKRDAAVAVFEKRSLGRATETASVSQNVAASEFLNRVCSLGYFDRYSLLGDGNVREWDWKKMSGIMNGDSAFWDFLLLGRPLKQVVAQRWFGETGFSFLRQSGLLSSSKHGYSLGSVSLISYQGIPIFVERGVQPQSFVGDETKALLSMFPAKTCSSCLIAYSRTGIEALHLANNSNTSFVLVSGGAGTSRCILRANLALNSLADRCETMMLKGAESRGPFDLIAACPPSHIELPGITFPKHVQGGADGLLGIRSMLRLANSSLSPTGQLLMAFPYFSNEDEQAMESRLRDVLETANLDYRLIIPTRFELQRGSPAFNQLAAYAIRATKSDPESVVSNLVEHLQKINCSAVYCVKARLWRRTGKTVTNSITRYYHEYYGSWTF